MDIQFPPGTPEDFQQFFRDHLEKQHMLAEDSTRKFEAFFDGLDAEQLVIFKGLMDNATARPLAGAFYEGFAAAALKYRFNACAGCGKNHDEEMTAFLKSEADPAVPVAVVTNEPDAPPVPVPPLAVINDCKWCRNERKFSICPHPRGSHGQGMRDECPEPVYAPCVFCSMPEWYYDMTGGREPLLRDSTCHSVEGSLLPVEEPGWYVCAQCSKRYYLPTE